jgi:hypothetical protein
MRRKYNHNGRSKERLAPRKATTTLSNRGIPGVAQFLSSPCWSVCAYQGENGGMPRSVRCRSTSEPRNSIASRLDAYIRIVTAILPSARDSFVRNTTDCHSLSGLSLYHQSLFFSSR